MIRNHLIEGLGIALVVTGQWWWLAGWCLLSMILCGLSYLYLGPTILGKTPQGDLPFLRRLINAPWIWEYQAIVAIDRWLGFEGMNEISTGLWLARRPLASEIPKDIRLVVDLTAESARVSGLPTQADYLCLPTLDGYAPATEAFGELVRQVSEHPGPVLIHCARGHGRSATVMAGVLLQRGLVRDVGSAYGLMKSKRKRVHLHRRQLTLLNSVMK